MNDRFLFWLLIYYRTKIMQTKNADLWGECRNIILQQDAFYTHESKILFLAESRKTFVLIAARWSLTWLKTKCWKRKRAPQPLTSTSVTPAFWHTSPCPNLATINNPPFRSPGNDGEKDGEREMDAPPTEGHRILPHHSRPLLLILNQPPSLRSPIYSFIEPGLYDLYGT